MDTIREKNTSNKQISIVVEYLVGNVRDTIQHMVSNMTQPQLVGQGYSIQRLDLLTRIYLVIPANARLGCISQTCWWWEHVDAVRSRDSCLDRSLATVFTIRPCQ